MRRDRVLEQRAGADGRDDGIGGECLFLAQPRVRDVPPHERVVLRPCDVLSGRECALRQGRVGVDHQVREPDQQRPASGRIVLVEVVEHGQHGVGPLVRVGERRREPEPPAREDRVGHEVPTVELPGQRLPRREASPAEFVVAARDLDLPERDLQRGDLGGVDGGELARELVQVRGSVECRRIGGSAGARDERREHLRLGDDRARA